MKKILVSCFLAATTMVGNMASAITIQTGQNVSDSCYPFGCATGSGEYQQAYGIANFSSPLKISGMTFFGAKYPYWVNGKSVSTGNFTITLSSSQKFGFPMEDNIGHDSVVVYDGALPNLDSSGNLNIIFDTYFTYNPDRARDLDLLLDVKWTNATSAARPVYFVTDSAAMSESSIFASNYNGLVTDFTQVPEPASLAIFTSGLFIINAFRRKRNKA